MWWGVAQKTGASAYNLMDFMGFGSFETAWTWLQKLRRAMIRPERDRLTGEVEVDEIRQTANQNYISGKYFSRNTFMPQTRKWWCIKSSLSLTIMKLLCMPKV